MTVTNNNKVTLNRSFDRLKEQEELFNSQKKEYEREINHLRNIIREKEDLLQNTTREKR